MRILNKVLSLVIVSTIGSTAGIAYGFDSQCEQVDGTACIAGPLTARSSWDTEDSEHADIWRQAATLAGLPDVLSAPFTIKVYTSGNSILSEGYTVPSLLPASFTDVAAQHTRTTSLPELTQLTDFSYALWDWTSGNETCPLGKDIAPERCHQLKAHMGVVNSNHFLPQAYYAYRHYHRLALRQAAQCKRVANLSSATHQEELLTTYLRPCEQLAMVYEAIGQHFLQDAWAMGHMWERWGQPSRTANTDHFDSIAVASTTALIHGARAGLQPALDYLGDFNDALSAPYHQEVRWKHSHSHESHSAVGDMYLPHMLNHDGLFEPGSTGEFSAQAHMLFSCAVTSILEVYELAGQHHGTAEPVGGLLEVDPMSEEDCFGQRATNEAMLRGAGVDVLWGGFWPYHLEIDSYTSTLTVLAASTYYADNYSTMSWGDYFWKQHQYRRDLARLMAKMELYAKFDPQGTQLASGAIGNLMNIKPNGDYSETEGLADYVDESPSVHPDPNNTTSAARESSTRLFHQAEGLTWCARYRGEEGIHALGALQSQVSEAERQGEFEAACGLCTEIVTRHVRRGEHAGDYDTTLEPLCELAPWALKEAFRPAFVYQTGDASASHGELARAWCGCDS